MTPPALPVITAAELPRLAYAHGKEHDPALTQPEKFRPIVNTILGPKPGEGGLWTAPVTEEEPSSGGILSTSWTDYRRAEDLDDEYSSELLEIAPGPRFQGLIIDSLDDVRAIMGRYRLSDLRQMPVDIWATFNWEQMVSDGVDALYLTDIGQWATRLPADQSLSLYSWDCATVLWLRPSYRVVTP